MEVQTSVPRGDLAAFRRLDPADQIRQIRGTEVQRVLSIDRAQGIDEKARTVWMSIASEAEYERWFGIEILRIVKDSIKTDYLDAGMALLVGHDTRDQVGTVDSYEITRDKKLRVRARFGRSARAEEVWRDVLEGIRRLTSVGYLINDLRLLDTTKGGVNRYLVTDFTVLEASLVAVPADPTVGVGRNLNIQRMIMENEQLNDASDAGPENLSRRERRAQAQAQAQDDLENRRECERVGALYLAGEEFAKMGGREIAHDLISANRGSMKESMELFKLRVREGLRGKQKPTNTAEPFSSPLNGYGDGARVMPRHGKLRCFTGDGGADRAYAFGQWIRAQVPGHEDAVRWCRENGVVHNRYLNSTTGAQGGYVVPDELSAEVIKNMDLHGVARNEARVWPMSSDALTIPRRSGGVTASFVNHDAETSTSDPSFGAVTLSAKEIMVVTAMTLAVMEDSVIDLADYVGMEISEAFATKEDQCLFIGDGTSTYGGMSGLNPKLLIATASQSNAAANHDTAPEIDATDLANLMAKLPQYAHKGAKWYMSMAFYGAIILRLMMAGGGNTIRTLEAGSSANPTFAGYEVALTPVLPSDVSEDLSGDVMMLFGNLRRSSAFGDRRVISLLLDPYTLAGKSQIRIIGRERFDIVNHDVGDTTTAGPVVALIGAA